MNKTDLLKRKIASKHNLTLKEVEIILEGHMKYVREEIREENLMIGVPYLGTFKTTEKKLKKYQEKAREKAKSNGATGL